MNLFIKLIFYIMCYGIYRVKHSLLCQSFTENSNLTNQLISNFNNGRNGDLPLWIWNYLENNAFNWINSRGCIMQQDSNYKNVISYIIQKDIKFDITDILLQQTVNALNAHIHVFLQKALTLEIVSVEKRILKGYFTELSVTVNKSSTGENMFKVHVYHIMPDILLMHKDVIKTIMPIYNKNIAEAVKVLKRELSALSFPLIHVCPMYHYWKNEKAPNSRSIPYETILSNLPVIKDNDPGSTHLLATVKKLINYGANAKSFPFLLTTGINTDMSPLNALISKYQRAGSVTILASLEELELQYNAIMQNSAKIVINSNTCNTLFDQLFCEWAEKLQEMKNILNGFAENKETANAGSQSHANEQPWLEEALKRNTFMLR